MEADGRASRPSLKYRPDIDGLRAIAVLSVLLFHVNSKWVPGGFVGVDIFLVISGYLITSIVFNDVVARRFSFAGFYKRRILRIAPAYFAVTAASLVAGALLLTPDSLAALAKSALWSTFSVPNVYFWKFLDTSYFAADTSQVPLLHLWSLGVEEQFYFLWPALLLLVYRVLGGRWYVIPLLLIVGASFAYAQKWTITDPSFAYYMLPARAGELLIGGLLALALHGRGDRQVMPRFASEALALAGYGLIGYALFALNGGSRFPGYNALYPCVGSAFLILAGRDTRCVSTRFLALKPMVGIGLISYSLYLWHWPVLAFFRYFAVEIEPGEGLACIAAIMVMSAASYRYIELPFRTGAPRLLPVGKVVGRYAIVTLALAGLSQLIIDKDGFRESGWNDDYRLSAASMVERTQPAYKYNYNCQSSKFYKRVFDESRCVVGVENASAGQPVDVILVGDSNAAHYIGVMGEIGKAHGFAFRNASVSSCPPVFDTKHKYGMQSDGGACKKYRQALRRAVDPYGVVVLGAQWKSHDRNPDFRTDLQATVNALRARNKQVVLLGLIPHFPAYGVECELRRLRMPIVNCEERSDLGVRVNTEINDYLRKVASERSGVSYLDVDSILCPSGRCSSYLDGLPVYYNPTHLSMTGSWDIGRKLVASKASIPDALRHPDSFRASVAGVASTQQGSRVESQSLGKLAQSMPDGFRFPFPYAVRWDKQATLSSGRQERSVDVHILQVDPAEGMHAIEQVLLAQGYVGSSPEARRGGIARNFRHADGRWINTIYWSRPVKEHPEGATGRITIGWVRPAERGLARGEDAESMR